MELGLELTWLVLALLLLLYGTLGVGEEDREDRDQGVHDAGQGRS